MAVLFIFIDGVGLGEYSEKNPFYHQKYESFRSLTDHDFHSGAPDLLGENHVFKSIDANLGVDGLPQSGTGQTSLFTGINASKAIGKHFGPYPHSGIKPFLKKESMFHGAQKLGKNPYFMNAYPPVFFKYAEKRNRWSCSTLMTKSAGLSLNSTKEVQQEKALTAEIIQNAWRERLDIDIPKISASDAAYRILNILPEHDLVLYEYYLTDKAGHNQSPEDASRVLQPLDEFLNVIIKHKKSTDTLVISSDHGNLEDLSVKTHTGNPVPLFVLGEKASDFHSVQSLTDVKPALMKALG